MMRRFFLLLAMLSTALLVFAPARAQLKTQAPASPTNRYALVIGNGNYGANSLPNTRPDAELIAASLRQAGFDVTLKTDLTRSGMFDATRSFAERLPAGASAVVYYAGHGMQIKGENYLLPVDMVITGEEGVKARAFPLQALHERLALSKSSVNVMILDACRNNPLQPVKPVKLRSFENLGLAPSSAARGTLVAYSTAPGQLAEDGAGRRHSIYTETLARLLTQRGLPAETLFRTLSDQVRRQTREDQQPWFESSLAGDFYFLPPPGWRPGAAPLTARSNAASGRSRGIGSIGSTGNDAWYRDMDESDWTGLDHELEARAHAADSNEMALLRRQAGKGNVVAMTTLGLAALQDAGGSGAERRQARAQAKGWFLKAARLGFPVAQTELGEMLYADRTAQSREEAIGWLEKAARARYPRARIDLAQLRMQQNPTPESVKALWGTIMDSNATMMKQGKMQPKTGQ
ncbi:caspase family protein [Massilia sp. IC2-278]|uniref:caspase family protein n=1 Tax=Massilia sp. IC2-278 TaxID=2887200 RepID=UPI001E38CBCE|nr:caspase family protein [Massilia sp. IC2-278]MCC2959793.1 caspase family protein [Massilia sp. IC2-278]